EHLPATRHDLGARRDGYDAPIALCARGNRDGSGHVLGRGHRELRDEIDRPGGVDGREGFTGHVPVSPVPSSRSIVTSVPMTLAERIAEAASRLTGAERRVALAVGDDPKIVAFGTVAQLAAHSGTSGPTVLRFASKLGFSGFAQLQ